jgi:hypothetical protein
MADQMTSEGALGVEQMKSTRARNRLLAAATAVGVVLTAQASRMRGLTRYERRLARQVRGLVSQSRRLDYADPTAEAAHYKDARPIIDAVVASRSRSLGGLRIKAETLLWCHADTLPPADHATPAERLVGAMVRDLLECAD